MHANYICLYIVMNIIIGQVWLVTYCSHKVESKMATKVKMTDISYLNLQALAL